MLLEFSLENFKCFKDEATLSFIPGMSSNLENHVVKNQNPKYKALRSAVIYGANGAGKSSLMDGARFMCNLVLNSPNHVDDQKLVTPHFQFDEKCSKKPIKFKIIFTYDKERYEYNFSYNQEQILTEKLLHYPEKGRVRKLFLRNKLKFSFGSSFVKGRGFKKVIDSLQKNQLLVSAPVNSPSLNLVYEFFKNCVFIYDFKQLTDFTNKVIHTNSGNHNFNKLLNNIMSRIDVGIESVHVLKVTAEDAEIRYQHLPDSIRDDLVKRFKNQDEFEVFFKHNGSKKLIPFKSESIGTQKLYSLLGPIFNGHLKKSILFIDELNSSLHPSLTEFILDFLHNQNKYLELETENQFIINLHDTSLLNPSIFRADQIWFIAKDHDGVSELYSLDDFKDRSNLIQRNYLDGKYGAIPVIKRFS
jgi:hypothetical protein